MSIPPSLTRSPYVLWDSVPRHAVTAMAVGAGVITGSDSGDIIAWKYDRESHLRSLQKFTPGDELPCDSDSLFPQVFTLSHTGCAIASIVNVVTHQGTILKYDKTDPNHVNVGLAFISPVSHFIALHTDGTVRAHTPTSSESYTITTDSPHHSIHPGTQSITKDGHVINPSSTGSGSSSKGATTAPHLHTHGGFTGLHVFYPTNYYWGFNSMNTTLGELSTNKPSPMNDTSHQVPNEGFFGHTRTNVQGQIVLSSSTTSYKVQPEAISMAQTNMSASSSTAQQLHRLVSSYHYNTHLLSSYYFVNPVLIVHGSHGVIKLIDIMSGRTICKLNHSTGIVRCDFSSSNAYSTLTACHIDPSLNPLPSPTASGHSSSPAFSFGSSSSADNMIVPDVCLQLPDPFAVGLLNVPLDDATPDDIMSMSPPMPPSPTSSQSQALPSDRPSTNVVDLDDTVPRFESSSASFPHNHSRSENKPRQDQDPTTPSRQQQSQEQSPHYQKPVAINSAELTPGYQRKRFLNVLTSDGVVHIWDLDRVLHTQARHVIAHKLIKYQQIQQQNNPSGGSSSTLFSSEHLARFLKFNQAFRHVPIVRYYVGPPDINAIYYLTREVIAPIGVLNHHQQSDSISTDDERSAKSTTNSSGIANAPSLLKKSSSFYSMASPSFLASPKLGSKGPTASTSHGQNTPLLAGNSPSSLLDAVSSPRLVSALVEANVTGDLSSGHKQLALPPTSQISDQPLGIFINDALSIVAIMYTRVIIFLHQRTLTVCGSIFLPVLTDLPQGNTSPSYFSTAVWLQNGHMLCVGTDSCVLAFHIQFQRTPQQQLALEKEKQRLMEELGRRDAFKEQQHIRQVNLTNHVTAKLLHILPMFHHIYTMCPSNDYNGIFLTYVTHDDLSIGSLNKLNLYALASTTKTITHLEYYPIPLPEYDTFGLQSHHQEGSYHHHRHSSHSSRSSRERAWLLETTLQQYAPQLVHLNPSALGSTSSSSVAPYAPSISSSRSIASSSRAMVTESSLPHSLSAISSGASSYTSHGGDAGTGGRMNMTIATSSAGSIPTQQRLTVSRELLLRSVHYVLKNRKRQLASILPIYVSNDLHMVSYAEINQLAPVLSSDTHTSIDRYNEDSDSEDESDYYSTASTGDFTLVNRRPSHTADHSDTTNSRRQLATSHRNQVHAINKARSYAQHCLVSQVLTDVQTGSIVLVRGFRSGHIVFVNITTNSPPFVITHPMYPFYAYNSPNHPYSVPYPVGLTSVFIMGICGVCVLFSDSSLAIYTVNTSLAQNPPVGSGSNSTTSTSPSPFALYTEPTHESSTLMKPNTAHHPQHQSSDGDERRPLLISTIHGSLQTGINSFFHPSLPLTQLMSALSVSQDLYTSSPPPSISSAVTMTNNKLYLTSSDLHKNPNTGLSMYINQRYPSLSTYLSTNPTFASHESQLLPLQSTFVSLHMCIQAPPSNQIYNSVHYLESFATRYSHDSRLCVADTQSQMLLGGWLNEMNNHRKHQIYKRMIDAEGYNTDGLVDRIQNVVDVEDGSWKSPFPSLIYPSLPIVSPATTIHPGECIFVTSTQHELFIISLLDRSKTFTLAPHSSPVLKVVHNHHCVLSNTVLTFTARGQIYVWSLTDSSLLEVIYRSIHDVWRSINPLHWLPLYFHVDIPTVRNVLVNMHYNRYFHGRHSDLTDQDLYITAAITQHASTLSDVTQQRKFMAYDNALSSADIGGDNNPTSWIAGDPSTTISRNRKGKDDCEHNIYLPGNHHANKNCPYCIARSHNIIVDIHYKHLTQQLKEFLIDLSSASTLQQQLAMFNMDGVDMDSASDSDSDSDSETGAGTASDNQHNVDINHPPNTNKDGADVEAIRNSTQTRPKHGQASTQQQPLTSARPKLPTRQYTQYIQSSYPSLSDNCHLVILQPNYSRLQSYLQALCTDIEQLLDNNIPSGMSTASSNFPHQDSTTSSQYSIQPDHDPDNLQGDDEDSSDHFQLHSHPTHHSPPPNVGLFSTTDSSAISVPNQSNKSHQRTASSTFDSNHQPSMPGDDHAHSLAIPLTPSHPQPIRQGNGTTRRRVGSFGGSGNPSSDLTPSQHTMDTLGLPPLMSLPSTLQQFLPSDQSRKMTLAGDQSSLAPTIIPSTRSVALSSSSSSIMMDSSPRVGSSGSVLSESDQLHYKRVLYHGKSALSALFEIEKLRIQKLINQASSKIADILNVDDNLAIPGSGAAIHNNTSTSSHQPAFTSTIPLSSHRERNAASSSNDSSLLVLDSLGDIDEYGGIRSGTATKTSGGMSTNFDPELDMDDYDGSLLVNDPHMHSLFDHCYYLSLIELQTQQMAGVTSDPPILHLHKQIVIDHITAHKTGYIPLVSLDIHTNSNIPIYNPTIQKIWYEYQQQQSSSAFHSQTQVAKDTYLPARTAPGKSASSADTSHSSSTHSSRHGGGGDLATSFFQGANCSLQLPFTDPMNTCDNSPFQTINIYEADGNMDMCSCHDCSLYLKLNTRSYPYHQWLDRHHKGTVGTTSQDNDLPSNRLRSGSQSTKSTSPGTIRLGDVTRGKFRISGISGCDINHISLYTHSLTHSCKQHRIHTTRDADHAICNPCEREMAAIAPFISSSSSSTASSTLFTQGLAVGNVTPMASSDSGIGYNRFNNPTSPQYTPQQLATLQMVNSIRSNAYYQEYAYHKGVSSTVVIYPNSNIVFSYNHTRKLLQEKQEMVNANHESAVAIAKISLLNQSNPTNTSFHPSSPLVGSAQIHRSASTTSTDGDNTLAAGIYRLQQKQSNLPHLHTAIETNPLLSTPVLYQGQSSVTMNDSSYPSLSMVVINNLALVRDLTRLHQLCNLNVVYDVQEYLRVVSTYFSVILIMAAYSDGINLDQLYTLTKMKFIHNHTTRGLCPSNRVNAHKDTAQRSKASSDVTASEQTSSIDSAQAISLPANTTKLPDKDGLSNHRPPKVPSDQNTLSSYRPSALSQHFQSSHRHSLMTPVASSRRGGFNFNMNDSPDDHLDVLDMDQPPSISTTTNTLTNHSIRRVGDLTTSPPEQSVSSMPPTASSLSSPQNPLPAKKDVNQEGNDDEVDDDVDSSVYTPMVTEQLLKSPTLSKALEYVYIATHYALSSPDAHKKLPKLPFEFPPIVDILPQNILYLHSYMILEPLSSNVIGPGIQNILGTASLLLGNHNVPASVPLIPIRPHPVFINTSVVDSLFGGLTMGEYVDIIKPSQISLLNTPPSPQQSSQSSSVPTAPYNADAWRSAITSITKESTYSAVQYNALDIYGFYLTFAAFTDDGNAISMILPAQKVNKFNKLRQKRYIATAKGSLRQHLSKISRTSTSINSAANVNPEAMSSSSSLSAQPKLRSIPPHTISNSSSDQTNPTRLVTKETTTTSPATTTSLPVKQPTPSPTIVTASAPPSAVSHRPSDPNYHKHILLPSLAFALTVDVYFSAFRQTHIHTLLLSLITMLQTVDAPPTPPYYPDPSHFTFPGSSNARYSSTMTSASRMAATPSTSSSIGIGVVGSGLAALVAFCSNVTIATTAALSPVPRPLPTSPIDRAIHEFTQGFSAPHINTISTLLLTRSNNPTLHAVSKSLLEDLLGSMSPEQVTTLRQHLCFEWSKFLIQSSHFSLHYKSRTDIDSHSNTLLQHFTGRTKAEKPSVDGAAVTGSNHNNMVISQQDGHTSSSSPSSPQWIEDPLVVSLDPPSFTTLQYKLNFIPTAPIVPPTIVLSTKNHSATFVNPYTDISQYILPSNSIYNDITALSHSLTIGSLPLPLIYYHVPVKPLLNMMAEQRRHVKYHQPLESVIFTGNGDLHPGVEISDIEVVCLFLTSLLEIFSSTTAHHHHHQQTASKSSPTTSDADATNPAHAFKHADRKYRVTSDIPSPSPSSSSSLSSSSTPTQWSLHQSRDDSGVIFPCPSSSSQTYICNMIAGQSKFVHENRLQLITLHLLLQMQMCLSFWDIGCKTLAESNNVLRFLANYYDPSHFTAFGLEYQEHRKIPPPVVQVTYTRNIGTTDPSHPLFYTNQKTHLTTTVPIVLSSRTVNILTLLCRIIARGYVLWEPYIADKHDLIMKLHCLSHLVVYPSLAKNASYALLQIGRVTPKQFIHAIAYQLFSSFGMVSSHRGTTMPSGASSAHATTGPADSTAGASLSSITNLQYNQTAAHISIELLKLNNEYMNHDDAYPTLGASPTRSIENEYDITLSLNKVQTYHNPVGINIHGYTLITQPDHYIYTIQQQYVQQKQQQTSSSSSSVGGLSSSSSTSPPIVSSGSTVSTSITSSFFRDRGFRRKSHDGNSRRPSVSTSVSSSSSPPLPGTANLNQSSAKFDLKQFRKEHTVSIVSLSQLPFTNPSILTSLSNLIKKYPFAVYPHIPAITQFIVTCLDPTTPTIRKAVIKHTTMLIQTLVLKFPCISFDRNTQRLLVSSDCHGIAVMGSSQTVGDTSSRSAEHKYDLSQALSSRDVASGHPPHQSSSTPSSSVQYEAGSVICYDLRSGSKVKTLHDKNTSPITACSLSPTTGQFCVTYSAMEYPQPVVKIWQLPSSGLFGSLFSSNAKCIQTHPLPKIHPANVYQQQYHSFQTIQKLMNVSITWEQEVLKGGKHIIDVAVITREDGSIRKYTCQ